MNTPILSTNLGYGILALLEILLATVVFTLCAKTALVRDGDPDEPDFSKRTFSLAKSQLAFWTVVVIGCFIYLYLAKGTANDLLNNTALLLLGISTGTMALAAAANGPSSPPAGAKQATAVQKHKDFIVDVLSDNQGMNIHRLQMLIWTIVFGGIFVYESVNKGVFPKFDDQAFVLMGISSATYVWFKRGET